MKGKLEEVQLFKSIIVRPNSYLHQIFHLVPLFLCSGLLCLISSCSFSEGLVFADTAHRLNNLSISKACYSREKRFAGSENKCAQSHVCLWAIYNATHGPHMRVVCERLDSDAKSLCPYTLNLRYYNTPGMCVSSELLM